MKNKLISTIMAAVVALAGCFAFSVPFSAAETTGGAVAQSQYAQDSIKGAAVLHCFNWSYNEIKNNLADIAQAGYTAVQTSPVQKPKSYSSSYTNMSGQWWKLYQPLTLSIADGGTWLGTRAELISLCSEADNYNIKVIVDIVANHMANNSDGGGYSHLDSNVESDLKNSAYYHTETYGANDDSRYEMTHGHIGMPDLNTGNSYVQSRVLGLLKDCVDCGVDGFRFDAAKHIELPSDDSSTRSDFWSTVIDGIKAYKSDVFCYGEILNTAGTSISNYTTYMAVTDNKTGNSALAAADSGDAAGLATASYQLSAGSSNTVLWAESHDTYMHDETSGISNSSIFKAWAITGARAKSTSLYLARPNSTMGLASSDGGWKGSAVREVNKFKNYFMGQSERLSSSGKVAYIERGTSGVSIAKLDGAGSVSIPAKKMTDGTYTDQITGNTFTVSNGTISGTVGSKGVAVVYNPVTQQETTAPSATVQPTTVQPTTVQPTTVQPTTVQPTTAAPTVEVLVGDTDADGYINVKDATAVQRQLAEYGEFENYQAAGDCDGSGDITIADVTLIQMYVSECDNTGYVGQYRTVEEPDEPADNTVYFTNTRDWSGDIYCYFWADSNTNMTRWPGEKMTYNRTNGSGQDIYTYTLPEGVEYLIFSNGSSQTVNIPYDGSETRFYAKSTTTSGKYDYGTW